MPKSGIAGSCGRSIFRFFWGASILLFIAIVLVYVPVISGWGFLFSDILVSICVLDDSHSDWVRCNLTDF
jgi:hypothetical protein